MSDTSTHAAGWGVWRRWRLRRSWALLGAAPLALSPGLFALLASIRLRTAAAETAALTGAVVEPQPISWLIIAAAVINGIFAILLVRSALVERALVRRVVATDGCVCPRCSVAMRLVDDGATPAHLDQRMLHCARCAVTLRAGDVRRYWEQSLVSPLWAAQWRATHLPRRGMARFVTRLGAVARRWPVTMLLVCLGVATGIAIGIGIVAGDSIASSIVGRLPMIVLFGLVAGLAGLGGVFFGTDEIARCTDCGYEQPREGSVAARCPECGADWHRVGGTAIGRPHTRRSAFATGAVLLVLMIAVGAGSLWLDRIVAPLLPSGTLISMLSGRSMQDEQLVAALERRELDAATRRQFAARAIELRARHPYLADDLETMLEMMLLGGELDAPVDGADGESLLDRFFQTQLTARIVGPTVGRPGEEVRLSIAGEERVRAFSGIETTYAWGGWRIDGAEPVGAAESTHPAIRLWPSLPEGRSRSAPVLTIKPPEARRVQISGTIWVIIDPAGTPPRTVRWSNTGPPTLDGPPPLAMRPLTVVHAVDVR